MSGSAPDSLTGSFRLDPPGSPLRSTQQLPVDYSNFENQIRLNRNSLLIRIFAPLFIRSFFDNESKWNNDCLFDKADAV